MMKFFRLVMLILTASAIAHAEDQPEARNDFKSFLEGVELAQVPFKKEKKVSFWEALSYIVSQAIELDPGEFDGKKRGLARFVEHPDRHHKDCVVAPEGVDENIIVFVEREVSLLQVVVEIAKQSELDLYTSSAGLVFCRPGQKPQVDRHGEKLVIGSLLYQVNAEAKVMGKSE